ncbi:hypothetical protein Salat_0349200 [Sesamum alatum]|uniref:Uncharacterized protein n=1 Tax=Sesamum alatum TaxID=300844 RepID=A0AAE1Z2F5_9LAMI|nr:hypothetical protein Salat_0349200 [Sesamum alatum]
MSPISKLHYCSGDPNLVGEDVSLFLLNSMSHADPNLVSEDFGSLKIAVHRLDIIVPPSHTTRTMCTMDMAVGTLLHQTSSHPLSPCCVTTTTAPSDPITPPSMRTPMCAHGTREQHIPRNRTEIIYLSLHKPHH